MAAGLNELASYLASNGGGTVYVGDLPAEDPDTASALKIYGGLTSDVKFGNPGIYREWPAIQVVSRGAQRDQVSAYTQAKVVHDLLTNLNLPQVINGTRYYTLSVRTPISAILGKDERDRYLYSFNIMVQKDPS